MTCTKRRLASLLAMLAVIALLASACSDSKKSSTKGSSDSGAATDASASSGSSSSSSSGESSSSGGGSSTADTTPTAVLKGAAGVINGGGSSLQDTYEQKVKDGFVPAVAKAGGNAQVNYTKSGSSDGKKQLAAGTLDFAGSDSPIKDDEKPTFGGKTILYFPIVASPITVAFHLQGVTQLKLNADTIAKIFQGEVSTWDDPAIKADNPDAKLPATKITVVHRSDGSGTTSNFTKYLKAAAPTTWKLDAGETVQWPATTQGAQNSTGVTAAIKQTDGAVGYADLSDAAKENLDVAEVKNAAGKFTRPTPDGASAALASATVNPDLTYNPLNAAGADAYPITSPTWILVPAKVADPAKAATLKAYVTYALTEGQSQAKSLFYAPLSDSLRKMALAQVAQITTG